MFAVPNETAFPPSTPPRYLKAALVVSVILFLFLAQRSFIYVQDDAYITFRYARSLAEGYGPVFNPGAGASDRTEGYSCPLFMLIVAVLYKLPLGLNLLLRAKFFGLACGLAVLYAAPKLAARLRLPDWTQAALPILLAAHAGISISSIDGMETILAALLTTLAALWFVTAFDSETGEPNRKMAALSALAFAGCALNRPEGLLMGLAAFGALNFGRRGKWGATETRWTLTFLLPVAAWFLFRHAYYGVWLPNTYYAKIAPLEDAVFKGATYLLRTFFFFLNESPLLQAVGAAWWLLVLLGACGERFRRFPAVVVPLLAAAQAVSVLRSGGDWMGGWRYMTAALPLLMLLSVAGIAEISNALRNGGGAMTGRLTAGTLCGAILAACLLGQYGFWTEGKHDGYFSWASKGFSLNERALLVSWKLERAVIVSEWLNANLPPGSVVAYSEMGVTPWLSPHIRFLDVDGLTDHGIATLPGAKHGQTGVDDNYISTNGPVGTYLKETRRPDYLLCGVPGEPPPIALEDDYPLCGQFRVPSFPEETGSKETAPQMVNMGVWKRKDR